MISERKYDAPGIGRVFFGLFCAAAAWYAPPAQAIEHLFLIPGATAGVTTEPGTRAGFDFSVLAGKCQDSCAGIGPTVGLVSARRREYYVGAAAGMAYFGSAWLDAAAHFRGGKASGGHVTFGMGFFLMGYGSLGYDALERRPWAELGVMIKAPFIL